MFISNVDSGLEKLVRAQLPLPDEIGDVAFEAPTGNWSAQLSRITVNFFLYDVQRSNQPSRSQMSRTPDQGAPQRRVPQPMVQLGYLVSAWAGSPRDEHQLLGDLVSLFAAADHVPAEYFTNPMTTSVTLALGDERSLPRELWTAAGGQLKASTTLQVTVGTDSFGWTEAPPSVERVVAMADRMDRAGRADS
ncbi:DUF4255 domain-containing protein [Nocardioides lianchengensis]|uniref:Pvc16 N-terminal domain-containing protein n=1 Tax=Nocardioides lianchengensis TaxID=1045774 RepID=A0A1G6XNV6_9ACTN|nr:DUF4255 domain-containing protein [Nocardioides lianchengensis]NYG13379.1 hypothetical protein [Nocardioides lianchengensis]SDD79848.1 Protein of unknown function [Nocardioides lianchengensis]